MGKGKEGEFYARLFADSWGGHVMRGNGSDIITVREKNNWDYFIKCEGKIEK